MEFVLNDYNRNVPDEDLLQDLRNVAAQLQTTHLSRTLHKKFGKYSPSTIEKRFGTWSNALFKAGLSQGLSKISKNNIDVTTEQLLEDIRNVAEKLVADSITTTQYDLYGKHGHAIIIRRFATWENALIAAGLRPTGFHHNVSKEDLLEEIERIWIFLGRQPTSTDIRNGISKFSLNSYLRKFESWRKALETFVQYVNDDNAVQSETAYEINHQEQSSQKTKSCVQSENVRTTKREINLRLRFLVMKRDNFKCCMCGRSPATTPGLELHIDHVIPWSKGGETTFENLQTLCVDCNLGKSDLT